MLDFLRWSFSWMPTWLASLFLLVKEAFVATLIVGFIIFLWRLATKFFHKFGIGNF